MVSIMENNVPVLQNSNIDSRKLSAYIPSPSAASLTTNSTRYIMASVRWVANMFGINDIDELVSITNIHGSIYRKYVALSAHWAPSTNVSMGWANMNAITNSGVSTA